MKLLSLAMTGLLSAALLVEGPAMSPWPDAVAESAVPAPERLRATLSTRSQSPAEGCSRRNRDCTFRPCCDNRNCRQNSSGQKVCR